MEHDLAKMIKESFDKIHISEAGKQRLIDNMKDNNVNGDSNDEKNVVCESHTVKTD